jgi:hypothetical protein
MGKELPVRGPTQAFATNNRSERGTDAPRLDNLDTTTSYFLHVKDSVIIFLQNSIHFTSTYPSWLTVSCDDLDKELFALICQWCKKCMLVKGTARDSMPPWTGG